MNCPGCGQEILCLKVALEGRLLAEALPPQFPSGFFAVGDKIFLDQKAILQHECGTEFAFVGIGIAAPLRERSRALVEIKFSPMSYRLAREQGVV